MIKPQSVLHADHEAFLARDVEEQQQLILIVTEIHLPRHSVFQSPAPDELPYEHREESQIQKLLFSYTSLQQHGQLHGNPHKVGQYHESGGFSNAQGNVFCSMMGLFDIVNSDFLHHIQHIYFFYFGYKNHCPRPLAGLWVQKEAL